MSPNNPLLRIGTSGALAACLLAGGTAATLGAQAGPPSAPSAQPAQPTHYGSWGIDLSGMDRGVRPQDDFFRFVNGKWLERTAIPGDRSNYGSFSELADGSEAALRAIIEEAAAEKDAPAGSDRQKVGDYYLSYMDSARVEQLGIQPLRAELSRIAAVRDRSQLPATFAHLQRLGVQTPVGFGVWQDSKQADRYIVTLSQSGLGLPDRDYYFEEGQRFADARAAYLRYVETLLRLAGDHDPAGGAKAIMELETTLAKSHWERARSRDREATYNRFSVAGLDSLTPGFSWTEYVKAAGAEQTPAVVVRMPDYFQAMGRAVSEIPVETWKRYMTFKLVDDYADEMSRPFADAKFQYTGRTLQGLEQPSPRWKRGVSAVEGAMGQMAGKMYVERHFRPEDKARMEQLVSNLLAAFRQGIDELEWMSPETRARAQEKLAKFNVKIGYPDKWPDYSALEVRRGDLVGNVIRAAQFSHGRAIGRLGKPIDRTEWAMTPQTVNAYYSSTMNEIVFPAAILQPPFFNPSADDAVNYGAIGAVIGHEISHGFDDQGSRSDGEGNLRNWWSESDLGEFKTRTDALVAQYDAFTPLEGVNVNGRFTLGENIGDLSGMAVAYRAYKIATQGKEVPVIDGFTGDQRFFLGWGQIWRRKYRDANLRQRILVDPHSPSEFRANGPLRNFEPFYAAFGVKPGDKLYLAPEQRVKIW
ncbi:MAG TPA: M13-type metalloendopeptidase [Longimicrobiaceae bacterium]|nr:M13-type metalloendopeptidase [Longimicrobiaceae bacterium]